MRNGILCSIASVVASAGIAFGDGLPNIGSSSAIPQWTVAATAADPTATQPAKSADGLSAGDSCSGICQSWNDNTCPRERLWIGADYLLWWVKSAHFPPLVTSGSPNDVAPGAIGQPGTSVLFGNSVGQDVFSGGRFTAGYWLTDCHSCGIDAGFFFLGRESKDFQVGSPGSPLLAVPFFNGITGMESSAVLSFPNELSGSVSASVSTRLWGTDLNLRREIWRGESSSVQVLAGFRHLELDERLDMFVQLSQLPGSFGFTGASLAAADHVGARNYFYGGQVGSVAELHRGAFSLALTGKVALGSTHQIANLNGMTTISIPGLPPIMAAQGALVFPSNAGRFSHDEFSVVPEVGFNLGYQVTKNLRATIGYTLLYWTDVARPGDQIDRTVNLSTRPQFSFHSSDFWAQGLNFGVEFRY